MSCFHDAFAGFFACLFLNLAEDFVNINQIVNNISEQINLFKHQSRVCVYVCVNVHECV